MTSDVFDAATLGMPLVWAVLAALLVKIAHAGRPTPALARFASAARRTLVLPAALALLALAPARGLAEPGIDASIDRLGLRTGGGWFDRARDLYRDERYEAAAEAYLRAARAGHRRGTAFYNAGCSYALAGDVDNALDALDQALDAGFDGASLFASDSDLDILRGEPRFDRMLEVTRRTPKAERSRRGAQAEYDALRASGSRDPNAWRKAGLSLLRAGEYSLSARAFEKQIAIEPGANAYYNLACALGLKGDHERALEALEQAVGAGYADPGHMRKDSDLRPLHGDPRFDDLAELAGDLRLFRKGWNDDDRKTWRSALPEFKRVTRENPEIGRAWFNLGYAYLKAGDPSGSYEAFERALSLGYRPPTTSYNMACASAQMGEIEESIKWLDRAHARGMDLRAIVRFDRDLAPLRSEDAFKERLAKWDRGR